MFRQHRPGEQLNPDAMRSALMSLPVPELSEGFNERIHDALAQPGNSKASIWRVVRPTVYGMCGSFAAALALLSTLGGWSRPSGSLNSNRISVASAGLTAQSQDIDALIRLVDTRSATVGSTHTHEVPHVANHMVTPPSIQGRVPGG